MSNPAPSQAVQRLIEEVPDVDDPAEINYWKPLGNKWVYLEGWIDSCLAGTGFPPMEEGSWDAKVDYIKSLTPGILRRKAKERGLRLIEGGFVAKTDEDFPEHLYGVTWGLFDRNPGGVYLMVIRGPKSIAPDKLQQLLTAGREQLSDEEYERLKSLIVDMQIYGLSAYLNSELGKIMSGISWELAISESPEWEEALIACDAAFLGRELKDMCNDAGLSPQGHKKELCARLYEADVPEVVAIMAPFLEEAEILPQTEPLYRSPLGEVKADLEKLRHTAPMEFDRRRRVIERAIQERLRGEVKTMPEFNLSDLQELVRSIARLYQ